MKPERLGVMALRSLWAVHVFARKATVVSTPERSKRVCRWYDSTRCRYCFAHVVRTGVPCCLMLRVALSMRHTRTTNETTISVDICLDGTGKAEVRRYIPQPTQSTTLKWRWPQHANGSGYVTFATTVGKQSICKLDECN